MRLVWQYRIPMPLSVEEQRVGLRFMIMEGMYRWAQDQFKFSKYYKEGQMPFKVYFAGKLEAVQEPCGWRTCLTLSPTIPKSCLVHAQRLVPALGPVVPVPAALRT